MTAVSFLLSRLIVVAMASALAGGVAAQPTTPVPELDALIAFADPAMCDLTPEARHLIGGFVRDDPKASYDLLTSQDEGNWIRVGEVPEALRDRFGPITRTIYEDLWIVRTEARGTLWGLPLQAIERDFPVGGDPGALTFVFEAPIETVERAARARGLVARAGESVPMGEPNGYDYAIILESPSENANLTRLTCDYWS